MFIPVVFKLWSADQTGSTKGTDGGVSGTGSIQLPLDGFTSSNLCFQMHVHFKFRLYTLAMTY